MKNLGPILIGGGVTLIVGYLVYDKFFKETIKLTNDETGETVVVKPGSGHAPPLPLEAPSNTNVYASVDAALLKNAPSAFKGKNVYARYDNTNIYTSLNVAYTKAAAGQLIGTFAGNTPSVNGGNMINIKTTDPKTPYVKAQGGQLKF